LTLIAFAITIALGFTLEFATDSTVPWCDAFTTGLSIIGMWMLAKKYIEQWWVWGIVDIVSAFLYIYKGLHFTAALYGLYAVIVVFGYRKWSKSLNL
jgi:nicotinamide mononucleotide transporter